MADCELCDHRPPVSPDAYLCRNCWEDTADRLERLPELAEELAGLLIPGQRLDGGGRGRPAFAPTPDLDRAVARYGFLILPSWQAALFDAPGWQRPEVAGGGLDARITSACIALRASMEWIVHWPAAGDFAREVKDLFADARSVTGGRDLPARMGPCPSRNGGVLCGAPLRLPDGEQVLRCDWCSRTYPPGVWTALRNAQDALVKAS